MMQPSLLFVTVNYYFVFSILNLLSLKNKSAVIRIVNEAVTVSFPLS